MIAVRWSDVGCITEPSEQEIEALTIMVEQDHIARWKADPEGIWEIARVHADEENPSRRWALTRWHPSNGTV
jgi:hypothetical protein